MQSLPLPSANGGPYTGDLTYYGPGLGACGITSANGDSIVAVSHLIFDAVSVGSNPNANPLCGKMIRARRNGVSVDLKVVDRCVGCAARDLDVTEDTFAKLADVALGRVKVEWSWLESVPGAAVGG
jgi:expansin (peptidoglycan-binding protein)